MMNDISLAATADAEKMDACDPLRGFRERFHMPRGPDGEAAIYFTGNSLGPQAKAVRL